MERSNRTGLPLSVLMIDVDHFKGYNDRHGHLAGDNALRGVSKILQHGRRANDVVARYGGEEFAIILLDVGKGAAKEVAERICAQVAEFPFEFGSTQPSGKLTISLGRRVVPRRRRRAGAGAVGRRSRAVRGQERRPQPGPRRGDVMRRRVSRRRPGRRRLGQRARRDRSAARSRRGAVGDRSRRGGCAGARSHQPALRRRQFRLPPRSRCRATSASPSRDRDMLVVAVPSAFVAATMQAVAGARAPKAAASSRSSSARRRAWSRGPARRWPTVIAANLPGARRRRAVRAQLRRRRSRAGCRPRWWPRRRTGEVAAAVQACFGGDRLRIYTSSDVTGVCVGGALKNVIAIAVGCCDGFGFGDNARAALITRGLAEMGRLAEKMGGRALTLAGLAGLGDLVLTCTGDLSRNRQVGLALARGDALAGHPRATGPHRRRRRHRAHRARSGRRGSASTCRSRARSPPSCTTASRRVRR